jgi:hypothetical protein
MDKKEKLNILFNDNRINGKFLTKYIDEVIADSSGYVDSISGKFVGAANMIFGKYGVKSDLIAISVPAYNRKDDPENPNIARGIRKLIDIWNKRDLVSGP